MKKEPTASFFNMWQYLIENKYFTEGLLSTVCDICGYTIETLEGAVISVYGKEALEVIERNIQWNNMTIEKA